MCVLASGFPEKKTTSKMASWPATLRCCQDSSSQSEDSSRNVKFSRNHRICFLLKSLDSMCMPWAAEISIKRHLICWPSSADIENRTWSRTINWVSFRRNFGIKGEFLLSQTTLLSWDSNHWQEHNLLRINKSDRIWTSWEKYGSITSQCRCWIDLSLHPWKHKDFFWVCRLLDTNGLLPKTQGQDSIMSGKKQEQRSGLWLDLLINWASSPILAWRLHHFSEEKDTLWEDWRINFKIAEILIMCASCYVHAWFWVPVRTTQKLVTTGVVLIFCCTRSGTIPPLTSDQICLSNIKPIGAAPSQTDGKIRQLMSCQISFVIVIWSHRTETQLSKNIQMPSFSKLALNSDVDDVTHAMAHIMFSISESLTGFRYPTWTLALFVKQPIGNLLTFIQNRRALILGNHISGVR